MSELHRYAVSVTLHVCEARPVDMISREDGAGNMEGGKLESAEIGYLGELEEREGNEKGYCEDCDDAPGSGGGT